MITNLTTIPGLLLLDSRACTPESPSPWPPKLEAHAVQEVASLVCFPLSHTLAGVPSAQGGKERALHGGGEGL